MSISRYTKQAWGRYARLIDSPVETKEGVFSRYRLTGLPFTSLNRAGYMDFESAAKLTKMETLRTLFSGSSKDTDQVVTKATTHTLHSELHDPSSFAANDLSLVCDITEVGNKSFVRRIQLLSQATTKPLITSYVKRVNSDRKSQMPLPLDPEFKERCQKYITSLDKAETTVLQPFPFIKSVPHTDGACFVHKLMVSHSDMDVLFHTNQASYLKYCLDAASVAMEQGCLESFRDELSLYPCKYSESLYFKQTFANECLTVYVHDTEEENALKFKICNHDEELIFSSLMTFYAQDQGSS